MLTHKIAMSTLLITSVLLTACGESSTDEPLPEGTAPTDAPREEPAAPDTTSSEASEAPEPDTGPDTSDEPTTEPTEANETSADDDERSSIPGLTYVLPEGWTVGPEKSMRLLTLLPENVEGAELAISRWPGDVGGFPLNVNRWARQVGLPPIPGLMTAETSDFEKFEIDGTTATWIPLMNEDTNSAILAVWVPVGEEPENPDQTWTFKLTCDADQVQKLAPDVRAWCESIEFTD